MLKFFKKVFDDCAKGRSGIYSYERVGTIIYTSWVISITTIAIIVDVITDMRRNTGVDLLEVTTALKTAGEAILFGVTVFAGAIAARRFATRNQND